MATDALRPVQLRRPGSLKILFRCLGHLRPYRRLVISSYVLYLTDNGVILVMPLVIR